MHASIIKYRIKLVKFKHFDVFLSLFLFLTTFFTTTLAGTLLEGYSPFRSWNAFSQGFFFSIPLMMILLAHEMGHYLMCRYHGIQSTPPYFIPVPPYLIFPIGTLGALIRIKSLIPNRRALLEMGAAGPLSGLLVAIPIYIAGLTTSYRVPSYSFSKSSIILGDPIFLKIIQNIVLGKLSPDTVIIYNSIAFAAWIGFLVTVLNLLPVGQLDGGHILYALFRQKMQIIGKGFVILIITLGFLWPGWILWAIILTKLVHFSHPPTESDNSSLHRMHKYIAIISIILFLLFFMPIPISTPNWKENLEFFWHYILKNLPFLKTYSNLM